MSLRRRRDGLAVAAFAVAVSLVSSCSSAPGPSEVYLEADLGSRVLRDVQALDYPFESDPSYAVRVANVQTRLINACVERQGIVAPVVAELSLDAVAVAPSDSRLWLLPSADYGVASALADPVVVASLTRSDPDAGGVAGVPESDSVAYNLAVYGPIESHLTMEVDGAIVAVPVAGCFGEATRTMYGVDDAAEYERAYYAVPNIGEVMQELQADDDVRRTVDAWAGCMKESGYRLDSPSGLYGLMSSWIDGVVSGTMPVGEVRAAEAALAGADTACRTSSGFGTTASQVFVRLAEEKIAGSEGVIQEYRRMIEHAQSVIAAGSSR